MTLLLLPVATATTIELSPGSDVAALTAALQPGDEVLFAPGTYPVPSPIDWTGLGTETSPITLKVKGEGEAVLELATGWTVAQLHDASWWVVEGLTFRTAETNPDSAYGFYVSTTDNVVIRDCEFGPTSSTSVVLTGNTTALTFEHNHVHDSLSGSGVYVGCYDGSCWAQDSLIANNWVHGTTADYTYGIVLANGNQGITLRDNVVYDIKYGGIAVSSTEYGDPNVVEGNAVWNTTDYGIGVFGSAQVRNNVVFLTGQEGIYSANNDRDTLGTAAITHNTVADTAGFGIYLESWAGRENMVLANNVVSNPTGYGLGAAKGGIDDTNYLSTNYVTGLVYRFDLYAGGTTPYFPGGGGTDFADPEAWDFYPAQGSLLIGSADEASAAYVPGTDFNGAPRDGDAPDVGAYEWDGAGNPGWVVKEGFKDLDAYTGGNDDVLGGGCCQGKEETDKQALLLLPLAGIGAGLRRRRR